MPRPAELGGRTSRFILLASTCVVVAALYFGREVLVPLALAILLSFLLTPAVRRLERWRVPRTVSVLIVVLIGVCLIGAIGYIVEHQFRSIVDQLPTYEGRLRAKIHGLGSHGGIFRKAEQEVQAITGATTQPVPIPGTAGLSPGEGATGAAGAPTTQPTPDNPLPVRLYPATTPLSMIRDYAQTLLYPLVTAGLVLVFVIFMLLNREDLRDRMIRIVGHGRLNLTTQALDEASTRISRYLGALAIVNALYAVCTAAGLWLIGHLLGHGQQFPNVLVWGVLVGLFRFVPYVGIWIGSSFPLLLSFALFPGDAVFFATLGLFIVLEVVVSQFIEPVWYGQSTGMSALAVLVSAIFWTWLWGPIGLLLSTPLTVCLVVMGKYVPQLQFLDILLGDEPVLPPPVRLYQRLIAGDEEEASELAREQLDDKPLDRVFDEVLVPALALAETDHHRGRLEDERLEFLRQSLRGIVEELAEEHRQQQVREAAEATEKAAKDQPPAREPAKTRVTLPKGCLVNVLCLPSKSPSDEIVCQMLAQLLEMRGYCVATGSADSLASEMVDMVERTKAHIVCVSAMPPAAVAHARYLCKRIHGRFPDMDMLVGLWTFKSDIRKAKSRIACSDTVHLVTTLDQAQDEIDQLAHSHIVDRGEQSLVAK